jgi:predicted nuclease with RNAse H fold
MPQGESNEQIMGSFTRFIGVDLGGGRGKKTALAVLDRGPDGVTVTRLAPRPKQAPLYDKALFSAIRDSAEGAMVCVDAPLTLPPCLRCTEPACPGQEACIDAEVVAMRALATVNPDDLYLRKRGILARETLGQGMGPLAARAAHLVRALAPEFRLNDNLIEVYPRATLELIGFREPYKKRVDRRIDILAALPELTFGPGVWREQCRQSDHVFDAVLCAYTGYLRHRDGWHISPLAADQIDPQGWIWVPPEPDSVEQQDGASPDKPAVEEVSASETERLRGR